MLLDKFLTYKINRFILYFKIIEIKKNLMTIRYPDPNIFDQFLKYIGKKRGVIVPINSIKKYGSASYVKAYKESFYKALMRPKNQDLPKGLVDIFLLRETMDN